MGSREKHVLSGWLKPRVSPSCTWEPSFIHSEFVKSNIFCLKIGYLHFETMKCQTLSMVPTKLVYQCLSSFSHWTVDKAWENTTLAIQLSGQWGQCFHITSMETISVNFRLKINILYIPSQKGYHGKFVSKDPANFLFICWSQGTLFLGIAASFICEGTIDETAPASWTAGGQWFQRRICHTWNLSRFYKVFLLWSYYMFYPSSRVEQAHTPKSSVWGFHSPQMKW